MGKLLDALLEGWNEGRHGPSLPEVPPASTDDFRDYATDENLMPTTVDRDGTESEPVRVISHALDFLGHVVEETTEWIQRETGHEMRPDTAQRKPMLLATTDVPASSWKATRYDLSADRGQQVAQERDDRKFVRLVNWGPDVVYVSRETLLAMGTDPIPNTTQIPVSTAGTLYAPVDFPTTNEIWAGTLAGDTADLEVIDFFGVNR